MKEIEKIISRFEIINKALQTVQDDRSLFNSWQQQCNDLLAITNFGTTKNKLYLFQQALIIASQLSYSDSELNTRLCKELISAMQANIKSNISNPEIITREFYYKEALGRFILFYNQMLRVDADESTLKLIMLVLQDYIGLILKDHNIVISAEGLSLILHVISVSYLHASPEAIRKLPLFNNLYHRVKYYLKVETNQFVYTGATSLLLTLPACGVYLDEYLTPILNLFKQFPSSNKNLIYDWYFLNYVLGSHTFSSQAFKTSLTQANLSILKNSQQRMFTPTHHALRASLFGIGPAFDTDNMHPLQHITVKNICGNLQRQVLGSAGINYKPFVSNGIYSQISVTFPTGNSANIDVQSMGSRLGKLAYPHIYSHETLEKLYGISTVMVEWDTTAKKFDEQALAQQLHQTIISKELEQIDIQLKILKVSAPQLFIAYTDGYIQWNNTAKQLLIRIENCVAQKPSYDTLKIIYQQLKPFLPEFSQGLSFSIESKKTLNEIMLNINQQLSSEECLLQDPLYVRLKEAQKQDTPRPKMRFASPPTMT